VTHGDLLFRWTITLFVIAAPDFVHSAIKYSEQPRESSSSQAKPVNAPADTTLIGHAPDAPRGMHISDTARRTNNSLPGSK
jgi:hypothetical protein